VDFFFFGTESVEISQVYEKCPGCESALVPMDHAVVQVQLLGFPYVVLLFSCGQCGSEWSESLVSCC
jgi:hypothetical protein